MDKLSLKQLIEIECIKKNKKITELANSINMSRQLMWHHVNKNNPEVISKIEIALNLSKGTLNKL